MIDNTEIKAQAKLYNIARHQASADLLHQLFIQGLLDLGEEIPSLAEREWYSNETLRVHATARAWEFGSQPMVWTEVHLECDFSDLLEHIPHTGDLDIEEINASWNECSYYKGILHMVRFSVKAAMDSEYLETLRSIGKVRMEHDSYSRSYESIRCAL
jgi:hypothetical protein